jgi:hypothetical protein
MATTPPTPSSNLIDPTELQIAYLTGVKQVDNFGNPWPTPVYQNAINNAVDWFETETHIRVNPYVVTNEAHDYYAGEYVHFCYIKLYEFPLQSVQNIAAVYPTGQTILMFPSSWIKLYPNSGQVMIVPTAGTLSQVLIGQGGSYLPLMGNGLSYLPGLFQVSYTAGFALGQIPASVNQTIAMRAAISLMGMASANVMEPGIGTKTISIDGLSQSSGVASGIYGPYSPLIRTYQDLITANISALKAKYQGMNFVA